MRDANPTTIYLKDYTPPEFLIDSVDLDFQLDETATRVTNRLVIRKNPASTVASPALELVGEQLTLLAVRLNSAPLSSSDYQLSDTTLRLPDPPLNGEFVLEIDTQINPKANSALEGLYLSNGMFCTQCEAEGFRTISYFLDRPDVMARYTTTITADQQRYPVLLSNGNRVDQGTLADNRHWVRWVDPHKKPSYLFALVAGQLEKITDHFITASGRRVTLEIFVESHDLDKCDHAMASLKKAMIWDQQVFGLEYDLDLYMIVAVGHFNMGAMENKGLNIFNTKFVLARPDTATDTDYEQIEAVIGHEYFHNWSGNRVTCRDWFQLSLKEGLTVFRDQQFTADHTSPAVKRIEDVNMLRSRQFIEDAGPLAHPVRPDAYIEINNFYTLTVYEKGAEVVRMIHTLVGVEGFRKGMDLYFKRHDGQAVTTDDFVSAMEAANEIDLSQFRRWYSQAGTPQVNLTSHYDAAEQTLTLILEQRSPMAPNLPLLIPLTIGLLDSAGNPLTVNLAGDPQPAQQSVLQLTESIQTFRFTGIAEQPVISILRGFSAPIKLTMERSLNDSALLFSHDSDPFNRWEAGQQLAANAILRQVEAIQQEKSETTVEPVLIEAFSQVLTAPSDDLSYLARLLTLPSESYLGEQMEVIDAEAVHIARQQVMRTLTVTLRKQWDALYFDHHRNEANPFDADARGRRAIKNLALSYLSRVAADDIYALCEAQFHTACNMTDQIAALNCIVNSDHPAKAEALAKFYQQWQNEALVIDKWFSLQATCQLPGTVQTVQQLLGHPAFKLTNPNRVRALIGAFSQANPRNFHCASGAGYRLLGDQILTLNTINPQIAARIVAPLTQWKRFDSSRQAMMIEQLERIVATDAISKNLFEVASKSLG